MYGVIISLPTTSVAFCIPAATSKASCSLLSAIGLYFATLECVDDEGPPPPAINAL